jgi:cytochrome P450
LRELTDTALRRGSLNRVALRRAGASRVWPSCAKANRAIDDVVMPLIAQRRADPRHNEQTDVLALRIGDYCVDPGTRIVVHIIAINRNPGSYERPNEFRPERGGVKRCLGASFSMRELITVLHVLLREGELTAVDEKPERIVRRSIMLAPRRGTQVRFRPRNGA